ncbi:hypothetical protein B0H16DRAFT_1720843 [Mycena metata]|uniref:F-box domain-containing protein n=1 Tax=Mycena metata TaxID=1033252 RepID=A0AAD7J854_9AGAR|nr:hypothetical protein B0H16DRAFT_1720843 [Mycena metata]
MDFASADIEPYTQLALGPVMVYQTSSTSSDFKLPMELWIKIVLKLLRDPKLSPSRAAAARAVVACVCKDWQIRVYAVPELWTHITIYKNVTLSKLDFRSMRQRPTVWPTAMLVDAIFDRTGRTSSRWASFELCTENPLVFRRVHYHCSVLQATTLSRLQLSYVYMPGYSDHMYAPVIYDVPFQLHPWFLDNTPYLRDLQLFCSTIDWNVATTFSYLERVEISDFASADPLKPEVLPALLAGAPQLRVLVLGAMREFSVPAAYNLESGSLEELDLELQTLTVRHIYTHIHYLLANPRLLSTVDRFTAYGLIGGYASLEQLFGYMPYLCHLDLSNSTAETFRWYCLRVFRRAKARVPDFSVNLRSLAVGRVSVRMVLRVLQSIAGGPIVTPGISRLRIERPPEDHSTSDLEVLRAMVEDFALTKIYYYPTNMAYALSGPTAHSLFTNITP